MSRWQKVYQNPETARQGDDLLDSLLDAPPGSLEEAKRRLFAKLRFEVPDARVIRAMEQVPREAFVPPELHPYSYQDRALPIGEEQTISQPLIVAIMTSALELRGDEKVLEIGTGSGYQAAVPGAARRHRGLDGAKGGVAGSRASEALLDGHP